jgi:hypothetical protein
LLDQAATAHQALQASFNSSAAESLAQREALGLELQRLQQLHAQDSFKLAATDADLAKAQHQIESLQSANVSLQQQARPLGHSPCL